jgi:hypothetical protein
VQTVSISINAEKIMHLYSFGHVYRKKHVQFSYAFENKWMEIIDWASKRSGGNYQLKLKDEFFPAWEESCRIIMDMYFPSKHSKDNNLMNSLAL